MDAPSQRTFGHLLRRYRLEAGLTHEELAERAHLSARAISALERGERLHPRPETVRLLATALGLDQPQISGLLRASQNRSGSASGAVLARFPPDGEIPPPPRNDPATRTNLPIALTSFVGRERELSEVKQLLGESRLVTLTGTGGCGKTRLALHVAAKLVEECPDGVWLVELAPLADPSLVPQAVAAVLRVPEGAGQDLLSAVVESLRPRHLLLILDNCEHLVHACAGLADAILRRCPRIRILATSREPLGTAGEVTWRVPPLALPPDSPGAAPEVLASSEAIRLFTDRARAALPGFTVTVQNVRLVAQICRRLDGIPLAIELAATRVKALGVEEIAARLDRRFALLTGGSRTAPPRQQTLRATIDWSHDLLSEPEQALFRRLAVFAGGFALEAAEGICAGDGLAAEEVLPALLRLVDQSLVESEARESIAHFRLLETIRAYAAERLGAAGEANAVQRRHRDWYVQFAEEGEPRVWGVDQKSWADRLQIEHDNLRAALRLCLEGDPSTGLRLAYCLHRVWLDRGYLAEGQRWLEDLLARTPGQAAARGAALLALGRLRLGRGDVTGARIVLEDSVAVLRARGDLPDLARALGWLGVTAISDGDLARAKLLLEESVVISRTTGDDVAAAVATGYLGNIARLQGDDERARAQYAETLSLARQAGELRGIAWMLRSQAAVARSDGDAGRARELLKESLRHAWEIGHGVGIAGALVSLGIAAQRAGDDRRALRLLAAATRESLPVLLPRMELEEHDACLAASRAALDEAAFAEAWAEGQAMTLQQAVEYALRDDNSG